MSGTNFLNSLHKHVHRSYADFISTNDLNTDMKCLKRGDSLKQAQSPSQYEISLKHYLCSLVSQRFYIIFSIFLLFPEILDIGKNLD